LKRLAAARFVFVFGMVPNPTAITFPTTHRPADGIVIA